MTKYHYLRSINSGGMLSSIVTLTGKVTVEPPNPELMPAEYIASAIRKHSRKIWDTAVDLMEEDERKAPEER